MIITKKKPEEVVDAMIAPFPKLFVVGCGTCSTKCMSGGEEQVKWAKEVGWRKLIDVAREKIGKITKIYEAWIKKLLKDLKLL